MWKQKFDEGRLTAVQTAILMFGAILVSKCIGFARELIYAASFGTSYITDAYSLAQSIPGILFQSFFSGIGTAYMLMLAEQTKTHGEEAGGRFTGRVLTLIFLVTGVGAFLGVIFAPQLIAVGGPGFDEEKASLACHYMRTIFPFLFFGNACYTIEGYLKYHNRFLAAPIAGYAYNLGAIALIVLSTHIGYRYLGFSQAAGTALQFSALLLFARQIGYRFPPNMPSRMEMSQIITLGVPAASAAVLSQINGLIDKIISSGLPDGRLSALGYGATLSTEIKTLTTVIITTIFYPKLLRAVGSEQWDYYCDISRKSITVSLLIAIPFSLGAIAFSEQVVQVIYERGAFDTASTAIVAESFRFYSAGITFSALNGLLNNILNSLKDVRMPFWGGTVAMCTNIALNLLLVGPLQHKGLALATSVAAAICCVIQLYAMRRRHGELAVFPPVKKILDILLSALLAVVTAILVYRLVALIWLPRMLYLGIAVLVAVAVYLALLKCFRVEEVKEVFGMLRGRS